MCHTALSMIFAWSAAIADAPALAVQLPADQGAKRKNQETQAESLHRAATTNFEQGRAAQALDQQRSVLEIRTQLYPASTYPDGHPLLASTLSNIGVMLDATGDLLGARKHHEQALAMRRKLFSKATYPEGHEDLASSLVHLSSIDRKLGAFDEALRYAEESVAMRRKLYPKSRFPDGTNPLAESLNALGLLHQDRGELVRATELLEESLAIRRKMFPAARYPKGHADLATSIANLGLTFADRGESAKAVALHTEAVAMLSSLYSPETHPNGHPTLAAMLCNLGTLLGEQGDHHQAQRTFEQALAMCERLFPKERYPKGHSQLARAVFGLAAIQKDLGAFEASQANFEKALAMRRAVLPAGHPEIAASLNGLGYLLSAAGKYERALPVFEEALALRRAAFPKERFPAGHPELIVTLINLASELEDAGLHGRAIELLDEALAMARAQYPKAKFPNGHLQLAAVLLNVSSHLQKAGAGPRALPLAQEGVAMIRGLFPPAQHPNGHPTVAVALSYLAEAHRSVGDGKAAVGILEEMLAIQRRLAAASPRTTGNHGLFLALNNLSHSYIEQRRFDQARPLLEEGMKELRLLFPANAFPNGHQYLAATLLSQGMLSYAQGDDAKARELVGQSAVMQRKMTNQVIETMSEAESLSWIHAQAVAREALLSLPDGPDSVASTYQIAWESRAPITRVLEMRHAASLLAGSENAGGLQSLRNLRRKTERLLQDAKLAADERDKALAELADEQDRLERRLASAIPELKRWRQRDSITPVQLAKALPETSVFIDLQSYFRFERGVPWAGAGKPQIPRHYVAFVTAPRSPTRRIELGPATPIDDAVERWLADINGRRATSHDQTIFRLVWEPISRVLSSNAQSLFIASDGSLAKMPWAAVPIGKDRLLLEQFAVATVPHGPFLYERLGKPLATNDAARGLAIGGVDFSGSNHAPLPGTAQELDAVSRLSKVPMTRLTGKNATSRNVVGALAKASYAHLATHGFFAGRDLAAEQNRLKQARKNPSQGKFASQRGASRHTLGYVGIVLAGGEVLSGLSIVDLPLENLRLTVLSACETGLGELVGGEGVQGLQRAFHLAGCPNVVASLWKVPDVPTLVLMEEFYGRLWRKENPLPPIEALREAQLAVMRNPRKVLERLGSMRAELAKRGLSETELETRGFGRDLGKLPGRGAIEETSRSPAQWWAGFTLSGVGR